MLSFIIEKLACRGGILTLDNLKPNYTVAVYFCHKIKLSILRVKFRGAWHCSVKAIYKYSLIKT